MRLAAVLTGKARPIAAKSGLSGIFKVPRPGAVMVGTTGLDGDTIVDTDHHGGPEQAVYLMGSRDGDHWQNALGSRFEPGLFGENLIVDGTGSPDWHIGDRFAIGSVVLELTGPRIPCETLAARTGDPRFPKAFMRERHPGAYARVCATGPVQSGMPVIHTPATGNPAIVAVLDAWGSGFADTALLARIAACVPAHAKLRAHCQRLLDGRV
jgi:MOSC domain-containing protein YiiM